MKYANTIPLELDCLILSLPSQRYYDEHEKLRLQAEKSRAEEDVRERQQQLQLEEGAMGERAVAISAGVSSAVASPRMTLEEHTSNLPMEDLPEPEVIEKVDLQSILPVSS